MPPRAWLPIGIIAALPLSAACTIELSPAAVIGDTAVSATLRLSEPAPSSGLIVRLDSSAWAVRTESQLTIPGGHSTVAFTISTSPVAANTHAVISVAAGQCNSSAGVTVYPPILAGVSLADVACSANSGLRGAIMLNGPAPATGAVVTLQSSDLRVIVPAYVTIPPGHSTAEFSLSTGQVLSRNAVAVTATYGASAQTALLNVLPGI
jgi:hypothetical protein